MGHKMSQGNLDITVLPQELCCWSAVVLTSTFGASTGDYMSKEEGLNLGTYLATGILVGILVVIVVISAVIRNRRSIQT